MKKTVTSLLLLILFTGLSFAQSQHKVKDKQLDEISGIAASRAYQDMFYVHNDSGGEGEIYLINKAGRVKATIQLHQTTNRDWEDIAVGPGSVQGKNYIYIGEIGDNKSQYNSYYLYRVLDASWRASGFPFTISELDGTEIKLNPRKDYWGWVSYMSQLLSVDSLGFVYEDGPKDCETLMIDPANGDVYLVSKREEKVGVYQIKAPLSTDSLNVAKRILSLDFPLAVGGDISPQRDKIIIKTYNKVYQWRIKPDQSIAEALSGAYEILRYKVEPQGEAICYSADGKSYLTISEKDKKKPLYLYKYPLEK